MAFTKANTTWKDTSMYCERLVVDCVGHIAQDTTTKREALVCDMAGCPVMERILDAELSMDLGQIAKQPLVFEKVKAGRW